MHCGTDNDLHKDQHVVETIVGLTYLYNLKA